MPRMKRVHFKYSNYLHVSAFVLVATWIVNMPTKLPWCAGYPLSWNWSDQKIWTCKKYPIRNNCSQEKNSVGAVFYEILWILLERVIFLDILAQLLLCSWINQHVNPFVPNNTSFLYPSIETFWRENSLKCQIGTFIVPF